jgi:hypothetical protein
VKDDLDVEKELGIKYKPPIRTLHLVANKLYIGHSVQTFENDEEMLPFMEVEIFGTMTVDDRGIGVLGKTETNTRAFNIDIRGHKGTLTEITTKSDDDVMKKYLPNTHIIAL